MNHFAILVLVATIVTGSCTCRNQTCQHASQADSTKAVALSIHVDGMTCTNCENTITTNLAKVNGIFSPTASYTDSLVTLRLDTALVSVDSVKAVIAACGFVPSH